MPAFIRLFALCFLVVFASSPVFAQSGEQQSLAGYRFSSPEKLGLTIKADTDENGQAVSRITTAWPTSVNLAVYNKPVPDNVRLDYSARVKTENLEGEAYLEMWVHFGDKQQYFSRGLNDTVTGDTGWKTIRTVFFLQNNQSPDKVTLNLVVNGKGTVWVDNAGLAAELLDAQ